MASKPVPAAVFALLVHDFTSSRRVVCQLEHLRILIYTIYTFYTAIKEGFATASYFNVLFKPDTVQWRQIDVKFASITSRRVDAKSPFWGPPGQMASRRLDAI